MAIRLIPKNIVGDLQAVIKGKQLKGVIELSNSEWITLTASDRDIIAKLLEQDMLEVEDDSNNEENFYPICIQDENHTQNCLLFKPANSKQVKWILIEELENTKNCFKYRIKDKIQISSFSQYNITYLCLEEGSEFILNKGSDLIL